MNRLRKITIEDLLPDKKSTYSEKTQVSNIPKYRQQKEYGAKKRIKP